MFWLDAYRDGADAKPDKIRDWLYISGFEAAENRPVLKAEKITHVLNLTGGAEHPDFKYLIFGNVVDMPSQDILQHFPVCMQFIDDARKEGGKVLVHCAAGISRSSTICVAYLMREEGLSVTDAIDAVRQCRKIICPNIGFQRQLKAWREMNFALDGKTRAHRQYKLHKKSIEFHRTGNLPNVDDLLQPDPHTITYAGKAYNCAKCERKLVTEGALVDHERGIGPWGIVLHYSAECDGVFCEPHSWMAPSLREAAGAALLTHCGDLTCPNTSCSEVVGLWNWKGLKCGCGTHVEPSFKLLKHKVIISDS